MGDIGFGEILVIGVVALVLFGPNKLPEFARQCGRAVSLFKEGLRAGLDEPVVKKAAEQAEKAS